MDVVLSVAVVAMMWHSGSSRSLCPTSWKAKGGLHESIIFLSGSILVVDLAGCGNSRGGCADGVIFATLSVTCLEGS
jgi:hypothetical protein